MARTTVELCRKCMTITTNGDCGCPTRCAICEVVGWPHYDRIAGGSWVCSECRAAGVARRKEIGTARPSCTSEGA